MSKKVLVISCSLRGKSNTEAMAKSFAEGAGSGERRGVHISQGKGDGVLQGMLCVRRKAVA